MHADPKEQSWVTTALDDSQCLRGLVLCRSLRRVFTNRKIAVLISRKVSKHMRVLLEENFDAVLKIDEEEATSAMVPLDTYAKVHCWQLTVFKKCIFIDSDSLVLENIDELFEKNESTISPNMSIFIFKPAFVTFDHILELVKKSKDNGTSLKKFFGLSEQNFLSAEYNSDITESCTYEQFSSAVKSVRFIGRKPWLPSNSGVNGQPPQGSEFKAQFYEILSQVWMNIFCEDLAPKINSDMDLPSEMREVVYANSLFDLEFFHGHSYVSKEMNENLNDSIAVVGMSCRFPGANSHAEFWELLSEGKDAVKEVPFGRWDAKDVDVDEEDLRKTQAGFLKCPVDEFDAKFFGISPREAGFMDPQQRLLLEVAWEGLENAGINPTTLKGSNTGVFVGIWTADYEALLRKQCTGSNIHRVYLGNAYSATSARVSFFLGLNGPNIATESGCSSSFVSIHLASESLRRKECNMALAGGVNLLLHPYSLIGSEKPYFMAADGHCKTFDAKADGFGRAEGCGMVILKRFVDAVKDGDRILGVIRGSAVNSEGTTASFGTPSKQCQETVIHDALKNAKMQPENVSYVEAHGTGTIVGDPTEVSAITGAYSKGRQQPLIIGSVKTNIGHAEGAAGIAGLIKVLLSMQHHVIPPHRNFDSLNADIDLSLIPAVIPVSALKWETVGNKSRVAGISSFGISGTNVHMIVEEPPKTNKLKLPHQPEDRTHHILTLSAKNERALTELTVKYQEYFLKNPAASLADIAHTANIGRAHFNHRCAVIGKDLAGVKNNLEKKIAISGKVPGGKPTVAFLFTGQGSQYPGMAKVLYETHPVFKKSIDDCEKMMRNNLGISVLNSILSEVNDKSSSILDQTLYSQTTIFCVEYSLLQLWKSFGIKPDYVLGHSVGEFAAAAAAGIMSFSDALKLVSQRSNLIQSLPPGGMMAVKASLETVKNLLNTFESVKTTNKENWLDIAVVNSIEEVVVAGRPQSLEDFSTFCTKQGIKTLRVAATHAFHSRDMETILEPFGKIAQEISYSDPTCGYISGRDGKQLNKEDLSSKYWQNHARDSVNFTLGIKTLYDSGCRVFVEVGPHPVLLALALTNLSIEESMEATWLPTIRRNEEEWSTILSSLAKLYINGVNINWSMFDSPYERQKLELPTYPFQRKRYWYESIAEANSLTCNTKVLHPLLGRNVPVATNDMHVNIYQHTLLLDNLPYLSDHQVANKIIMPGAGFFEMILAAGNLAIQGSHDTFSDPKTPFVVDDFVIEAPLEILVDKVCRLQTIGSPYSPENSEQLKISIMRKSDVSQGTWKRHASAKFNTVTKYIPEEYSKAYDLELVKSRCTSIIATDEMYAKIAEVGIAFGPLFQTIKEFYKGENEVLAEISCPPVSSDKREYICHPIILDAMLQAYAFQVDLDKVALYLPVAIEKFYWMSRKLTSNVFLYISWETNNTTNQRQGVVQLLDKNGFILAVMKGVRLVKTSIATFVNFLNAQKREVPGLFHEVFRPKVGTKMSRLNMTSFPDEHTIFTTCKDEWVELVARGDRDIQSVRYLDLIPCDYFLKTFYKLGWKPQVGQIIQARDLMTNLLISFRHEKFIERILQIFTEIGYLSFEPNSRKRLKEWRIVQSPPSEEQVNSSIEKTCDTVIKESNGTSPEIPVIKRCGEHLAAVLEEKEIAFDVLFPENSPEENATRIYTEAAYCTSGNIGIQILCRTLFAQETVKDTSSGGTVRILEVGGGVGSTTDYIIEAFNKMGVPFSYTFTDISPVLTSKAAQKFKGVSRMTYKVFDIEKDPKNQGFAAHQYDIVIGSNVLHATADIEEALTNLRHVLVPGGYLTIVDMFSPTRHIDLIYGVLDSYWKFKDYNIRPDHALMPIENWEYAGKKAGFETFTCHPTYGKKLGVIVGRTKGMEIEPYVDKTISNKAIWIIFGNTSTMTTELKKKFVRDGKYIVTLFQGKEFSEIDQDSFTVDPLSIKDLTTFIEICIQREWNMEGVVYLWGENVTQTDQDSMCAGLLHFAQLMLTYTFRCLPKMFIVTKGMYVTGDEEPVNPTHGLIRGLMLSMKSEQPGWKFCLVDLDRDDPDINLCIDELYDEIWINDGDALLALRQRKRFIVRLCPVEPTPAPLIIPNSERYKMILPASNQISDLLFKPATKPSILQPDEIDCLVKASALNFRDLFVVLKPAEFHSEFWEVGLEFAGVVMSIGSEVSRYKVGDNVFGFTLNGAIGSHCVTKETMVMRKPDFITHAEAATMPTVFFTSYFGLVMTANIKSSDIVLIHVASGGVGISAIQMCQYFGTTIIATAGSRRKRAFLRSQGIKHVFHSRNTNFGDEILAVTNGRGVDVVLNSLTGPNFKETSLKVCAPNARFVEMSKINIWTNEEVEKLRPDVAYTVINLEYELDRIDMSEKVEKLIFNGTYKPLPYIRFDITQVKEAFMYFQQAHHIGKIVLDLPEIHYSKGNLEIVEKLFNSESTYLITGGLGGIGLEVAKFMSRSGARNFVLVGRNPPSAAAEEVIKSIMSKGVKVVTLQVDVGNLVQCEGLFRDLKSPQYNLPPLRGIMHAAGVLSDGMLNNQTMEKFNIVFNAKVNGAWNLHNLSQEYNLEHFVLYSSAAALLGPMGQSPHSGANTFLDTFAHYRHALGLPVQTINWGIWSEIGAAAELALGKEGLFGIKPFSPAQGIAALKTTLKYHYLQVAVTEIDINQFKRDAFNLGNYIEEIIAKSDSEVSAELVAEGEKIWKEIKETVPEQRAGVIKFHIESMIRQTLKLPADEPIDENQSFSDMGLDSLMAVEMRNKLQMIFGKNVTLNTTALLDNPNISALSSYLANLITANESSAPQKLPTKKLNIPLEDISFQELVREDCILPDTISGCKNFVCPTQIKTVFLTGVTGQLGIFVLPQLTQNTDLKIYCIIRGKTDEDAKKRLIQRLKKYKMFESTNLSNVVCLTGNVVDKRLGLSISKYDELSEKVDAIIHCAVKANHVEAYKVQKVSTGHDLRSVNVLGTVNVLAFACHTRTKQVLHASSLVAIAKGMEESDGSLNEKLPADDEFGDEIRWGYALSKFICEKLVKQAIERGIPCKVLRFPTIVGHSVTGQFAPETNHLMLFLLACMHLGKSPKLSGAWSSLPVDIAAKIAAKLLFNATAGSGAFNVNNPYVVTQQDLVDITTEGGHFIQLVDEEEWIEALKSKGEDSILFPLKELYVNNQGLTSFLSSSPVGDLAFQEGRVEGLQSNNMFSMGEKLSKILPDIETEMPHTRDIFKRHLEYADKTGIYKMFGIEK